MTYTRPYTYLHKVSMYTVRSRCASVRCTYYLLRYLPTYLGISINRVDAVYLLSKAFMHTFCYSWEELPYSKCEFAELNNWTYRSTKKIRRGTYI